jgi:hypothetical protein
MLEAALEEERRGRADAIRDAVEQERANSKTQKQLAEMRKELMISKEEARRAWEELGRREQEERDRTISLQQGHPTIVGGVQVVPMNQGVPSRQTSTREYQPRTQAESPDRGSDQQAYSESSQAPPAQPATSPVAGPSGTGGFYQQPETSVHNSGAGGSYGGGSEGGYSEGEYMIDADGNFIRDAHGDKIPFRDSNVSSHTQEGGSDDGNAEDYETPASHGGVSYPPSSSNWAGNYPGAPEYSGQGYAAPAWEAHHHPSRLSDVPEEEEERSRTSASQVSRA